MPNEFVGPEKDLQGLANASWGSMAVILKNGQPDRLVLPGSRFGRGWRAPLMGNLTYVPLQTDSVKMGLRAWDIATADGYHISLTLDSRVKFNPAHHYAELERFLHNVGRGFAEDLVTEVQRGLTQLASEVIGRYAHAELRRSNVGALFGFTGTPLVFGSGLMVLTHLAIEGQIGWDPKGLDHENVYKDTTTQSALDAADAQLLQQKVLLFQGPAAALGLPVGALIDPHRHELTQDRALQAMLKLLEPGNRSLVQRHPELLQSLAQQAGVGAGPSAGQDALQSGAHLTQDPPELPFQQLPAYVDPPTEIIIESDEEVELTRNTKLRRAWLVHEDRDVIGIAVGGHGSPGATVVAVTPTSGPPRRETFAALGKVIGHPPGRVLVLVPGSWQDLVEQWFEQALPEESELHAGVQEVGDDLTIAIFGPARQANRALRKLLSPEDSALAAFEELTPFVRVHLVMGG